MYDYRKLSLEQRQQLVEERLARGNPPHQLPHSMRGEGFYLLTATCYEHCHHLHTPERRQTVLDLLFEQFIQHGLEICAWTVQTSHYHLLAHVHTFDALGDIFRRVHGRTAHDWNQQEGAQGRKVWYR